MRTIRLMGEVDEQHRLLAQVPSEVPPGRVALTIAVPSQTTESAEEDAAGDAWQNGIAAQWAQDLGDVRQDIYTLDDGESVDGRG